MREARHEQEINKEVKRLREIRLQKQREEEEEKRLEEDKMLYQPQNNEEAKNEYQPQGKKLLRPNSFEIMMPLGAGAFGEVWLVKNKNNNDIMAMKVIDKERLIKDDLMPYANTEKNIMLQIKHPFIIALKHSFQTPVKYFLLMEYCCGGDLAGIIAKQGFVQEEIARIYIAEILLAIE